MNPYRPMFWHQGLSLQPQHLQLLDRVCQSLLEPVYRYGLPDFWGVGAFELDAEALAAGTVALAQGAFLFPDGTFAVLHQNAILPARALADAWPDDCYSFDIYLGLKRWNDAGPNAAIRESEPALAAIEARLLAPWEPEEVPDLHAGGPPLAVKRQDYLLRLCWESELPRLGDYHLIPLARLIRSEAIRTAPDFIPPCLALSGSAVLADLIREIRDRLEARGRELELYKPQRGAQSADRTVQDATYLLELYAVNRHIPQLAAATREISAHPCCLYGMLTRLVAELSTFSDRISASGAVEDGSPLPPYDHRHLGPLFTRVRDLIFQLLEEVAAGPDFVVQLHYDGSYYAAELRPQLFDVDHRYYLALHSQVDPGLLLASLPGSAKVAPREQLPQIVEHDLPGIDLSYLAALPPELPRHRRTLYLALDQFGAEWDQVTRAKNLALYWAEAPSDLEVELMVLEPRPLSPPKR